MAALVTRALLHPLILVAAVALGVCTAPIPLAAQEPSAQASTDRTDAVRVFLDCHSCDENYLRTEVTFISYVRDRTAADVHVLVTTEGTGGGGTQYTLKFIGLGRFKGVDNSLTYSAPQTATSDARRRGFTEIFKLGLVRYVTDSSIAGRLKLTFDAPANQQKAEAVRDPWNFWVFRVGAGGNLEGQQQSSERSIEASFSANRTTERWKINVNGNSEYNEDKFELEDGDTFTAVSRNSQARVLAVKSLNERWSVGGTVLTTSSTFQNYDLRTRIAPGIEYDFFPYAESTRRILTLVYSVGVQHANYTEETIFGKTSERLLDQELELSLALRQPWGSAEASVEAQHYLSPRNKYRVNAFGEVDVRLFKGFTLEMFVSASRRRDQLSLRRGAASTEEILVRQRELATGYQYEVGFGISYSFGSIFNNVVNPRFRNVGGG
ncbi:MAG: DUF481 domain-containing protein [Acidobacteria bacterium]|nr:DUF481 domain-containing protein [Acidobacteriota bacterium]MCA1651256.1 DUF481 domain-containing protein [Acidobacteriota bacterium]